MPLHEVYPRQLRARLKLFVTPLYASLSESETPRLMSEPFFGISALFAEPSCWRALRSAMYASIARSIAVLYVCRALRIPARTIYILPLLWFSASVAASRAFVRASWCSIALLTIVSSKFDSHSCIFVSQLRARPFGARCFGDRFANVISTYCVPIWCLGGRSVWSLWLSSLRANTKNSSDKLDHMYLQIVGILATALRLPLV